MLAILLLVRRLGHSSGCPADSRGPLIVKGKDGSTDLLVVVHSGGFDLCRLPEIFLILLSVSHQSMQEFPLPLSGLMRSYLM
jgi:secreted trypsin-like serine protease